MGRSSITSALLLAGRSLRRFRIGVAGACSAAVLAGCALSPAPMISDLIIVAQPLITGGTSVNLTASSQLFSVNGTCDPKSFVLQYSYDGTKWIAHDPGCVDGSFSIPVKVATLRDVYVRARGKFTYTHASVAHIHFIPPRTSDFGDFVTASRSDMEVSDEPDPISQYTMGHNYSGESVSSASHTLHTYFPAVVYEQ